MSDIPVICRCLEEVFDFALDIVAALGILRAVDVLRF